VITALDSVERLERPLKDSPDLIVLDVMMPRNERPRACHTCPSQPGHAIS
jgi:CheY-like chemotaxis protein